MILKRSMIALLGLGLLAGACAKRGSQEPVPTPTMVAAATPVPPLPTPVPTKVPNSYVVAKGDTLWDIAGQEKVQGNSFRWPLLFKANRDQIIDPDLIEPAQDLTWKDDYDAAEVSDAEAKAHETPPYVPHAKPRKQLPLKY